MNQLRTGPHFNGSDYSPRHDHARLTGQILRVFSYMRTGTWYTLHELAARTGDPHSSVSAQLRNLRKPRFGGFAIEKRYRGDRGDGLWEYRLNLPEPEQARMDFQ